MDYPKRKPNRLINYDYSQVGAYFITVCTKDKQKLFWNNVGARIAREPYEVTYELSEYGEIVNSAIQNIRIHYPSVSVDNYVIMPNHIHLLISVRGDESGRPMGAPTISTVINQLKGYVSKQIGFPVWQKLFYDHIIRGIQDYEEIWQYIDENPAKWETDDFY